MYFHTASLWWGLPTQPQRTQSITPNHVFTPSSHSESSAPRGDGLPRLRHLLAGEGSGSFLRRVKSNRPKLSENHLSHDPPYCHDISCRGYLKRIRFTSSGGFSHPHQGFSHSLFCHDILLAIPLNSISPRWRFHHSAKGRIKEGSIQSSGMATHFDRSPQPTRHSPLFPPP